MIQPHSDASRLPSASVVVVSYNTAAHIIGCIESLLALDYPRVEIIVVDNGSTDGSVELIRGRFGRKVDVHDLPENKGFAGGASVGLYMAEGEILCAVNPDVRLDKGWMRAVASTLDDTNVGIVGSRVLYPDGKTLQHAGGVVHYPLATTDHIGRGERDRGQYNLLKRVSFVTGAALAMRRDVGRSLGFFDDDYFPLYYEDVDLCWRAEKEGLSTIYQPDALAYHKETVTLDRKGALYYSFYHANRLRFVVKHYSPEQLMMDFLPAEAARVTSDMEQEDRKASLALLDGGTVTGSAQHANSHQAVGEKWEAVKEHLSSVMSGWQVYDSAHGATGKPGMRGKIGNLLNRLYLWPALQKQIDYNAELARTVRELSSQLAELQARVAVQSTLSSALFSRADTPAEDLSTELEDLRARLEGLERETRDANDGRR
ncbi:MAG: glycosyltransferase [Chloroflexia bacterium]